MKDADFTVFPSPAAHPAPLLVPADGCEGEADPSNATVHERGYVMLPTVTPDYGHIFGLAS